MKTKNLWAMFALAIVFSFSGVSCSSDDDSSSDETTLTETATDEAQAATLNDEVATEVDQYVATASSSGYMGVKAVEVTAVATTPTITITPKDSVTFPKTITIDFGTTGFTGKRGNVLKGKLIVVLSDKMWKANSVKTITFDNFYVNDNKVSGSKTITNKGLNASKNPYWTVSVKDTITRTDGTKVIWNSDRTRERIDNGGTPLVASDDKYSITGTSNGVNAKGKAFTMIISSLNPLIIYNDYPHFVQGVVTTTIGNKTATLDYGDGTKDAKATVTVNGVTKEISLKK